MKRGIRMPPASDAWHRAVRDASREHTPYAPQADLTFALTLGSCMCFVGFPVMYVMYAINETASYNARNRDPLPLVTDVFGDWMLASSGVAGVGFTLLFTGMFATAVARIPFDVGFKPRTNLVRSSIVATSSVWIVICSSRGFPSRSDQLVGWVHVVSTVAFMLSAVYTLYSAYSICSFLVDSIDLRLGRVGSSAAQPPNPLRDVCRWCLAFAILSASGILGAFVSMCIIAANGLEHASARIAWQLLAASELTCLLFGGAGYFTVIYLYVSIEAAAVASMARYAPVAR